MLSLSMLETYEQTLRDRAVQTARIEAPQLAQDWANCFAETHNELKIKLAHAKGDERTALREQMTIVARACDLFL